MNSFVFQNSTKVYFGNDSVSTYLPGLLAQYGPKVMLTYGGGSIKKTGIYEEIMGYLKTAGQDRCRIFRHPPATRPMPSS